MSAQAHRVRVFGGAAVRAAVQVLGHEITDDGPVAVIDADDATAVGSAAMLAASVPRVIIAAGERHATLRALGTDPSRLVNTATPAILGPVIAALLPTPVRPRTRVVAVTGTRGGVGRTLLATNLARRLARRCRVVLIDATGSGAAAWWLDVTTAPWPELEGLVNEMSADHLAVIAREAACGAYVVGAGFVAPTPELAQMTVRAATAAFDLVLIDMPPVFASSGAWIERATDRRLVLTYDDPISAAPLSQLAGEHWIIASQTTVARVAPYDVLRSLPRDESAVSSAAEGRSAVGGRLGHAYDDIAELLWVDATR